MTRAKLKMILTTKRLIIREFTSEDLDPLSVILKNEEVMKFSVTGPLSFEQTKELLQKRIIEHYVKNGFGLWALICKETGQLIGFAGLISQSVDGEALIELGYRLDPAFWGKGLASEANIAIVEHAFKKLHLAKIISIIDPQNIRSLNVASRIGMRSWKKTTFHGISVQIYILSNVEVSDQKWGNFQSTMRASACYLEIDHQILLIQQQKGKTDEGMWGVPAGKLEPGETPEAAARRELFEETGIQNSSAFRIVYLQTLYIRKPDFDYIYYMFKVHLNEKPSIELSVEHSNYRWADDNDLRSLPLRPGGKEALEYYRKASQLKSFTVY